MNISTIITYIVGIIILVVICKLFSVSLKSIIKLLFNSVLGGVLIYIINLIGAMYNFHIGLNVVTSIFIGILGIPGSILLIVLKIVLG